MAALSELFGDTLKSKSGDVKTSEALGGKGAVAIYFSAHWCPPCRGFTPEFAKWYTNDLAAKGLEVVFVSSDKDQPAFDDYFGEQPWLALPYSDRDRKNSLSKKYKVQGIPSLVIVDAEGQLITKDGREAVSKDPTGAEFPWKPRKLNEILGAAKVVDSDGEVKNFNDLTGKATALYFSAHWCPPCRGFTPKLAEWYKDSLKDKGLDIVFVSSDRDEAAFKDYFGEHPWHALEYSDRKAKDDLSNALGIQGIPSLVILDKDGSVINKDGRAALSGDPKGENFPWHPKPVNNFKDGPGSINELPSVIAFCETSSAEAQKAIEAAMGPPAKKFLAEAKAKGEDEPEIAFCMLTEASGIGPRIRGLLQMPTLPPSGHEHPLEKKEGGYGGWGCDGCGRDGSGEDRFRCTQGCDFDFCGDCNEKCKQTPEAQVPRLMLLDIPDDGGYYEGPEGDITEEVVAKFVADYQGKKLERKQLG